MHTKHKLNIFLFNGIALLLLVGLVFRGVTPVRASSAALPAASANDLIAAVNAYRAQFGLEPYSVDGGLMAAAQDQSTYQASIETCTHNRADGSGPGAHGISAENIACGPNLSPSDAINYQWTDQVHQATLVGPDTGQVGAGMATMNGTVYYTLAVRRLTGEFVARAKANTNSSNPPAQDQATQAPPPEQLGDLVTSTPNADGSIAHVLKYGETLVQIARAYGISLNDLISMNHLDPQKPVYFAGQVLTIRIAFTPSPFVTTTYTPRPPTRTPLPTRTPRATRTPVPEGTPLPTPTVTRAPLVHVPSLDDLGSGRPVMAYAFIGISAVGLIVLVFTSFLGRHK